MNEKIDEKYASRCIKKLEKIGAPLEGWICKEIVNEEELGLCELCGCSQVRFKHIMEHPDFYIDLHVGCICAGIMEGNILEAKRRERKRKNYVNRKKNFMKKKWKVGIQERLELCYKGYWCFISKNKENDSFTGFIGETQIFDEKGNAYFYHEQLLKTALFNYIDENKGYKDGTRIKIRSKTSKSSEE